MDTSIINVKSCISQKKIVPLQPKSKKNYVKNCKTPHAKR